MGLIMFNNRRFCYNDRGFTFAEVIVTLLIFSLLMTIAAPSFSSTMEKYKLNNDAQILAWQMRNARQEAITTCSKQIILFYTDNNKYKWMGRDTINFAAGNRYIGRTTFTQKYGAIPMCSFLPSGAPGQAGTITITNVRGDKKYVIVNLASGRVRVSSSPPESWE